MDEKFGYREAFEELQQIVNEIEIGDIPVDELTQKINRATALLGICKAKLVDSETEVEKLLSKLEQDQTPLQTDKN